MTEADSPEACAERAADPAWQADQAQKREAASARFAAYREAIGMPLRPRKAGERL